MSEEKVSKVLKYDPKENYLKNECIPNSLLEMSNLFKNHGKTAKYFLCYNFKFSGKIPTVKYVKKDGEVSTHIKMGKEIVIPGLVPVNILAFLGLAWKLKIEIIRIITTGNKYDGMDVFVNQFTKKTILELMKRCSSK